MALGLRQPTCFPLVLATCVVSAAVAVAVADGECATDSGTCTQASNMTADAQALTAADFDAVEAGVGLLQTVVVKPELAPTDCTSRGDDPWSLGWERPCCTSLQACLKDWFADGRWHYRCMENCAVALKPEPIQPPVPASPTAYHPHFDTTPDYLGIAARASGIGGNPGSISDNFYLVVSDWGACGISGSCTTQRSIAHQMSRYVAERRARNPNSRLLFVLACGDNFYWIGAGAGRFRQSWSDVYGPELTSVPWFAVMGNHDYGNDDAGAGCPHVRPRFVCDDRNLGSPACGGARPYSNQAQGYNSNQLNANKGGVDGVLRDNYHMPDYTYYYTIPELDFELIAMDWNVRQIARLGGRGTCPGCGAEHLLAHCGSQHALEDSMAKIQAASTELMRSRSALAASRNVAIINHYPDEFIGANLRDIYFSGMPVHKRHRAKVFSFFGHTHVQQCRGYSRGECVNFLTGGAGGCCSSADTPAGFVAISWDDHKTQVVECFAPDERCTTMAYMYRTSASNHSTSMDREACKRTLDNPRCPNYAAAGATTAPK